MSEQVPCPHCGEWINANAAACRHCGSDAETGWAPDEEIDYHSFEIPDALPEDFDYEEERSKKLGARLGIGFVALLIIGVFMRVDIFVMGRVFIVAGVFLVTLLILVKLGRRADS